MVQFANVVSGDSHVREPYDLWVKTIGKKFGDRTPRVVHRYKNLKGNFFFTGGYHAKYLTSQNSMLLDLKGPGAERARLVVDSGHDPDARVKFQKLANVKAEVLYPTASMAIMQCGQRDVAEAAAAVFNDWMAEYVSRSPNSLLGVAEVPTYRPSWALKELKRARKKGLRGAMINTIAPVGATPYRTKAWDKFWAAAQDLDIPIILHIVTGRVLDPIVYALTKEEYAVAPGGVMDMWNEIQNVVANEFIFGQILDRFPKLKVVEAEFEVSWIPTFMFRIDQMQGSLTPLLDLPKLKMKASDYVKSRIWHGMTDDPYGLSVIDEVGAGQFLWGSDFPHVRSISYETQAFLAKTFKTLSVADQRKVVGGNTARVFNA
ncbi:MAG: amidohydrolase [Alphaproteobacteria bacterium]|nr:amidohydrolase [Alphaproteobacteria bacterium]